MITLQKYGRNAEGCVPYEKIDGAEPKLPHLSFRASALKWLGIRFLAMRSIAPPMAAGVTDCHACYAGSQ